MDDPELEDPWEGINDTAKLCFKTLEEHLKIPVSVLRAIYDMNGQSTNALLMAVHEKYGLITPQSLCLSLFKGKELNIVLVVQQADIP